MEKRIKKKTAIIFGLLGALVVGGAIGTIAYVSKGFDKDLINNMFEWKYDYTKVDLSNNYKETQTLTAEEAVTALNYSLDENIFKKVTITSGAITQEKGGLALAVGSYKLSFNENTSFDHYAITAFNSYTESVVDEKTNYVIENIGSISISDLDSIKLPDNEKNQTKKPTSEKLLFNTEYKENEIMLTITGGKVIINQMQMWNTKNSKVKIIETVNEYTSYEFKFNTSASDVESFLNIDKDIGYTIETSKGLSVNVTGNQKALRFEGSNGGQLYIKFENLTFDTITFDISGSGYGFDIYYSDTSSTRVMSNTVTLQNTVNFLRINNSYGSVDVGGIKLSSSKVTTTTDSNGRIISDHPANDSLNFGPLS